MGATGRECGQGDHGERRRQRREFVHHRAQVRPRSERAGSGHVGIRHTAQ
ncbi:hypothetical protein MOTT27_04507 [Mycobacterium intracellulare subsp. yongonense]|nr:hypothetical protein MOTT27_04507 [Mycobacterium intracellulare subsp. yongonense]